MLIIAMKLNVLILNIILITIAAARVSKKIPDYFDGEYGDYFEGDMILTDEQYKMFEKAKIPKDGSNSKILLNGLVDVTKRWPKATVVYYFKYRFEEDELEKIKMAMQEIESKSCIKFRERRRYNEHAVSIQRDGGCNSYVGYLGNKKIRQRINLGKGCFKHGKLIHEILHTIGFHHMHSNYNRDNCVTIVWKNIRVNHTRNFEKYDNRTLTDFGVPYDYDSVMHYGEKAFSNNGQNTIITKKKNAKIGQRLGLSKGDIIKLNKMYNCDYEQTTTDKETTMDLNVLGSVP